VVSSLQLFRLNSFTHLRLDHAGHIPRSSLLFSLITLILPGEAYTFWRSSLWDFLQFPIICALLPPNNFLSTLFSNTFKICSSLRARDQVRHPYAYIFIFTFLYRRCEDKYSEMNSSKRSPNVPSNVDFFPDFYKIILHEFLSAKRTTYATHFTDLVS